LQLQSGFAVAVVDHFYTDITIPPITKYKHKSVHNAEITGG